MNLMSLTFHDLPQMTHAELSLVARLLRQTVEYCWEMTRDLDSWEIDMSTFQLRID